MNLILNNLIECKKKLPENQNFLMSIKNFYKSFIKVTVFLMKYNSELKSNLNKTPNLDYHIDHFTKLASTIKR